MNPLGKKPMISSQEVSNKLEAANKEKNIESPGLTIANTMLQPKSEAKASRLGRFVQWLSNSPKLAFLHLALMEHSASYKKTYMSHIAQIYATGVDKFHQEETTKAQDTASRIDNTINALKNTQRAYELIGFLFGEKKFDDLPELVLTEDMVKGSGSNNFDGIKPEDMTSPVMRFQDKSGRIGFAIRSQEVRGDKLFGNPQVQVFYQKDADDQSTWAATKGFIPVHPEHFDFLTHGHIVPKMNSIFSSDNKFHPYQVLRRLLNKDIAETEKLQQANRIIKLV